MFIYTLSINYGWGQKINMKLGIESTRACADNLLLICVDEAHHTKLATAHVAASVRVSGVIRRGFHTALGL